MGGRSPMFRQTAAKLYRAPQSVRRSPRSETKNGFRMVAEKPVPFRGISRQLRRRAFGERQKALFSALSLPDRKNTGFQIDIIRIKGERLADAQAGNGDQAEQCGAGQRPDAVD